MCKGFFSSDALFLIFFIVSGYAEMLLIESTINVPLGDNKVYNNNNKKDKSSNIWII